MESKMRPLWDHQKKCIEMAKDKNHFFLFFEVGTGKSATSLRILADKMNKEKRYLRTIVFAPPIVLENWKNEFRMWTDLPHEDVTVLYGSWEKRVKTFESKIEHKHNIFITNFESLLMPRLYARFMSWEPEALIIDELHRIKSGSAKRTKLLIPLADKAKYKLGLTGSPILRNLLDLFSQFRVVDGGMAFGKNFIAFRQRYFYDKNFAMPRHMYFPNFVPRADANERLMGLMKDNGMVVKKKDCLSLPPLVLKKLTVELGTDQKRAYKEMLKDFITSVGDSKAVADLALTKGLRLMQILSGFVPNEKGDIHRFSENPRIAVLKELLEELTVENKVIVWCVFKENFKMVAEVCHQLNIEFVEVHGEISGKQKFENVDHFRKSPTCKVMVSHPAAGGIGINLIEASYCIFYSRTFSLEQSIQAEGRNYRSGSEIHEKITRIDLVAKETIDESILERLHLKQAISNEVLVNIVKGQQ